MRIRLLILSTIYFFSQITNAESSKTLGPWFDDEVIKCEYNFVQTKGQWEEVWDNCKSPSVNGIRQPLRKIGKNKFKQVESKGSWHYSIASSGDLEVRDNQGVVRVIRSTAPKTPAQLSARLNSEGVIIGMSKEQALASSWGKPRRINRTTTARGATEQWVYSGGYLYFVNGILTTIQN